MATDQERLLLLLEAQTRNFERALEQSERQAERRFNAIEKRANQMVRKLNSDFSDFTNQTRTALAALGVGFIARDVTQLADTWTTVGNRLAFAGVASERLAATQQAVADIASRTRSDLDATADLFARMYRSSEDLGASQERVLRVTEIVSKALAGASQSERQGAIRQLGQGLGSGRLQGDELRSILENSRPIAEAIAAEFDTTVGNLRKLGAAGVLESRRVFEAIERAGADIDAAFARTTLTVADSFTRLRTEAARFVGTNEQTSASVRGLTALIDAVADNFDLLADAAVIAATVIGGSFAGVAVTRAVQALGAMILAMTTASTRAVALRSALAFFGGPLGVALTVAGGAMAYLATQTDIFASRSESVQRAGDSLYSALQTIVSLGEALDEQSIASAKAAEQTNALADASSAADDALSGASNAAADNAEQMGLLETASRGLAEAEKGRAIATISAAIADQQALIAAERRGAMLRDLNRASGQPVDGAVRRRMEEADAQSQSLVADAQRSLQVLQEALQAVRSINAEFFANRGSDTRTGNSGGADSAARRAALEDLVRQNELTLARLRHEEARVRELEDAAALERRTKDYIDAGLNATVARTQAEVEVRAEREAMNAEARRSYEIAQQQDAIDLARIQNNIGLADAMSDQLEIARRTRENIDQMAMSEAEAAAEARAYVEARRAALDLERDRELDRRSLEDEAEAARLRGDSRAERALERQIELQNRITELRRLGLSEEAAVARAEAEVATLEQADLRGKFRDWFSGGVMAALEGDLDDFFENWIRERMTRGLENALDQVADILFDNLQGVLTSVIRSGENGLGDAIGAIVAGGATNSLDRFGEDCLKAGQALGAVLASSATQAASQIALTGVAAAASATKDVAAAATKQAANAVLVNANTLLAKSLYAAAAAAQSFASAAGSSSGGGSFIGGLIGGLFNGGGLAGGAASGLGGAILAGMRAGGGPMNAGMAYMVGERGKEIVIPQTPSFVVPNHMLGGQSVTLVERNTYNITGASTAEVAQLRQTLREDLQSRRATTVQIIREAARRPRGLG